jgi:hypothetical protein
MNIDPRLAASALIAAMGLAACTPVDAGMGESVRTNIAVQTIDPDPVYDEPALVEGSKMAPAVERYRTDKVKKPVGIKTTSGTGGSSSK